jgi:hypothetical protein
MILLQIDIVTLFVRDHSETSDPDYINQFHIINTTGTFMDGGEMLYYDSSIGKRKTR